jgi:hypothetical protein
VQKAREDFGHSKHAQRTKQQEVLAGWKTTQLHGLNVKKNQVEKIISPCFPTQNKVA